MRRALAAMLALVSIPALAAIETTTITGTVYAPDGSVATGGSITCALTPTPGRASDGANLQVVASRYVATISGSGTVSFTLVPNDVISPAGTVYACTYTITGPLRSTFTESWSVTTAPDPVSIGAIARVGGPTLTLPSVSGAAGTIATITGIGGIYGDADFTWDATTNMLGAPQGLAIDTNADATANIRLKSATVYGQTGAQPRPCWDLGGATGDTPDGTCDVFFDDARGLVRGDGSPYASGPLAIFSVWIDIHQKDTDYSAAHDWTLNECKTYGMPCGFNYQDVASGFVAADMQAAYAAGVSIGSHTTSHCAITVPDPDWSPDYALTQTAGRYVVGCGTPSPTCVHTGTVAVTEGAATLTGTTTSFAATCNANTVFSPVGARIFIDTDNDGTVELTNGQDYEGTISAVGSTTSLTLSPALLADQDGDSTSSEVLSGRVFEILSSPAQWTEELTAACSWVEGLVGDANYRCQWAGAPGAWVSWDGLDTVFAANESVQVFSGSPWDAQIVHESESGGSPIGTAVDRFHINPTSTFTNGLQTLMDQAVASKRAVFFSGHLPFPDGDPICASSNDCWSRTQFTGMLSYARTLMTQGKAIFADPVTAVKLARMWSGEPQMGTNLLGNSDFESFASGLTVSSGNVSRRWPWNDSDADLDINGTAQLNYDGTNNYLVWTNDGNDSEEIEQNARLSTGYYQASVWARLGGPYTGTNAGLRLCVRANPAKAHTVNQQSQIPVTWHTMFDGTEDVRSTQGNGANCSAFLIGATNKERQITGHFYVPPELDGLIVSYSLDLWDCDDDGTAGDCAASPMYIRDATLVRYQPQPTDSRFGGFDAVPRATYSGYPANAAETEIGAFTFTWHPNDAGSSSGQADNPTVDLFQARDAAPTDGIRRIWRVGKIGVNDNDAWRALGSPVMALGFAKTSGQSASCYMIGQQLVKGATPSVFSGAFCGRSTADQGTDILLNAATTQPAVRFKALNFSNVATETVAEFAAGGAVASGDATHNPVARILANGTLTSEGVIKLGTDATEAQTTGTNSMCVARKTDCNGATECVFYDFDCDGAVDAEDFCMHTDAIDVDC